MAGIRHRLGRLASPGTMLGLIALCVALSGTALAHGLITSGDVVNNSLRGIDVKDKSLTKKDFRGSVRGPRGPRGLTGATGAAGATNVVMRTGTTVVSNAGGNPGGASASCNAGERATGGGPFVAEAETVGGSNGVITGSHPTPETPGGVPTGWEVEFTSGAGQAMTVTAYVICASP